MSTDSPVKGGSIDMPENGKLEDYLAVLEEHIRNCEKEGKFAEAEMAKNRIEELKFQEAQRQLESLSVKHQNDKLQVDEAHQKEYEEFSREWQELLQRENKKTPSSSSNWKENTRENWRRTGLP